MLEAEFFNKNIIEQKEIIDIYDGITVTPLEIIFHRIAGKKVIERIISRVGYDNDLAGWFITG